MFAARVGFRICVWGAKSTTEGTRIEALQALTAYGCPPGLPIGMGLGKGAVPLPHFVLFLRPEIRILMHSPAHLSICFRTLMRPGSDLGLQYVRLLVQQAYVL